jgi:AraC-like DNA-binding protein
LDRILEYIKSEKPFLNFDFSIHDISGTLKLPQIRVSNSFNNQLKIPFPSYRNMCRIEHFLNLYENNTFPNYSIEGLARESGFQTKSSFYSAFKSVHNMTPMEYISKKELQKV